MQLTMRSAFVPSGPSRLLLIAAVGLLALALAASVAFIASRPRLPPPYGLASNGSIVVGVGKELWLMDADGGRSHRLDIGLGTAIGPVFSPDGTKFAFMSRPATATNSVMFVANADGTGARALTSGLPIVTPDLAGITWSPDGSTIVFNSSDKGLNRLYSVGVDGSGLRAISDRSADRRYPAWSPDGRWLAYRMDPANPLDSDAYLAISRPDGTGERRLLKWPTGDASFSGSQWAGDSNRITYFRSEGTMGHVVGVVGLDGTQAILSRPTEDAANPAVSPDGHHVAYGMYSGAAVVDLDDPSSRIEIPSGLAECGALWAPDATALLGGAIDCKALFRIPLDHPAAATRIALPDGGMTNWSWQRLAP
jgi:Tol biopolymer transport system component